MIEKSRNYIEYKFEYIFTEADYQEALERYLQSKKKLISL